MLYLFIMIEASYYENYQEIINYCNMDITYMMVAFFFFRFYDVKR